MENLAYNAILGRDFLQENGALIDLEESTLSFNEQDSMENKFPVQQQRY